MSRPAGDGATGRVLHRAAGLDGDTAQWLAAMERCVRARDFAGARQLFDQEAFSFGTRSAVARGLEELEWEQWREIWTRTEGFRFDFDGARLLSAGEQRCVAVTWHSRGLREDGSEFPRRGRATLVLIRRAGRLRCVHSHFSLDPGSEEVS